MRVSLAVIAVFCEKTRALDNIPFPLLPRSHLLRTPPLPLRSPFPQQRTFASKTRHRTNSISNRPAKPQSSTHHSHPSACPPSSHPHLYPPHLSFPIPLPRSPPLHSSPNPSPNLPSMHSPAQLTCYRLLSSFYTQLFAASRATTTRANPTACPGEELCCCEGEEGGEECSRVGDEMRWGTTDRSMKACRISGFGVFEGYDENVG